VACRRAIASEAAIRTLREELAAISIDHPAAALARAVRHVNERVRSLVDVGDEPIATTLVAALVRDGLAWLANVGDSRGYVFSNGRLEQITRDHSVVAEQVSAGVLTAEQAETSAYANVITRGIGVSDDVVNDNFGPIDLEAGDTLLLCPTASTVWWTTPR
jgi:protein phosphatase